MEKELFLDLLRRELVARDFPSELAEQCVLSISQTFNADDIQEIEQLRDPDEATAIVQAIAKEMAKKHDAEEKPSESDIPAEPDEKAQSQESKSDTAPLSADDSEKPSDDVPTFSLDYLLEDDLKDYKPPVSSAERTAAAPKPAPTPPPAELSDAESAPAPEAPMFSFDEDEDIKVYTGGKAAPDPQWFEPEVPKDAPSVPESFDAAETDEPTAPSSDKVQPSSRGRAVFWSVFFCTLPITALLFAAYYVLFAVGFTALCALIVGLFAALIGGVAVGTTVSLVGIIYGIVQLFTESSIAPGLYELGLGLTIAGSVMLAGILIYNCAIRFIPWVIRKLGVFFRFSGKKLRQVFKKAKEACYKL